MSDTATPSGGSGSNPGSPGKSIVDGLDRSVARAASLGSGGYSFASWAEDVAWSLEVASLWWRELESCVGGGKGRDGGRTLQGHPTTGLMDEPLEVRLTTPRSALGGAPTASVFRGIGWGDQLQLPAAIFAVETAAGGDSVTVTVKSTAVAGCIPVWAHQRTIVFEGVIVAPVAGFGPPQAITEPIRIIKPAYMG